MKSIITIVTLFCFTSSAIAQKKTKIVLGILYMKDTVTILYNHDTVFHSIVESVFNAHKTKEFEFTRKQQGKKLLRVHINSIRAAVSLKDYSKSGVIRIDCIPNPQNLADKEIVIYRSN